MHVTSSHAYHDVTTTFKYKIEPDRTYLALNLTPFFMILSYDNEKKGSQLKYLKIKKFCLFFILLF